MSKKKHSLLLTTEEERKWMIDEKMKVWFDFQAAEWKEWPKAWKGMKRNEIFLTILEADIKRPKSLPAHWPLQMRRIWQRSKK